MIQGSKMNDDDLQKNININKLNKYLHKIYNI